MRAVFARFARIKGKLQHLHAREPGSRKQRIHFFAEEAKILRNDREIREMCTHGIHKFHARPLHPFAAAGVLCAVWNAPVAFQAAEMVDPQHVVKPRGTRDPVHPPAIAIRAHLIPAVERIAPKLTVRAEGIRRNACHRGGRVRFIQLEVLRPCPNVRGIHGDINGQVADQLHVVRSRIRLERIPLAIEQVLHKGQEFHIRAEALPPGLNGFRLAQADVRILPLCPGAHAKVLLERHEQRIIRQPCSIFFRKRCGLRTEVRICPVKRPAQHGQAGGVNLPVIHARRVIPPVHSGNLLRCEKPLFHKGVKVDQVRVPREGRKRLIRRIAKARRAKRQDLPILLPGGSKKIDEAICFVAKRPDAMRRRKRRHRQQNAAAPFHGK